MIYNQYINFLLPGSKVKIGCYGRRAVQTVLLLLVIEVLFDFHVLFRLEVVYV